MIGDVRLSGPPPRRAWRLTVALVAAAASACANAGAEQALVRATPTTAAPTTVAPTTTTTLPPTTAAPTTTTTAAPATTTTAPRPHAVTTTAFSPFATVGGVTLHHPADRVERVGFHESNHDGARQLEPLPTAVAAMTLEPRERGTGSRSAADIVVHPSTEIRVPVTGTVKRAGSYTLYCDHRDNYAVIAPDAQPTWEVKLLHVEGMALRAGQRVVAGETVVAPNARVLPFESQVDEVSGTPAWPHVHIEVVDPSIKDRPSPGGGCS